MVRFKFKGREFKFPSVTTLKEARAILEEERSRLRANPGKAIRKGQTFLFDLLKSYLLKATHHKDYKSEIRFASFWNDFFHNRTVESITIEELEEARVYLLNSGRFGKRSHGTVNRHTAFLRKIFNEHARNMVHKGYNFQNPFLLLTPFKEAPPKENHILKEEEEQIKTLLSPADCRALDLAIYTGLRAGEQFNLQWTQIDFDQERILLPKTKAGRLQSVPLSSAAMDVLKEIRAHCPSKKWVFPHPRIPDRPISAQAYYKKFIKAVKKAGFQERGLVWHSARDTFATRLLESGANIYDVGELGRWANVANIIRRYGHLSQSHLKSVVERLAEPKVLRKKGAVKGPQGKASKLRLRLVNRKI